MTCRHGLPGGHGSGADPLKDEDGNYTTHRQFDEPRTVDPVGGNCVHELPLDWRFPAQIAGADDPEIKSRISLAHAYIEGAIIEIRAVIAKLGK